MFIYRDVLWLTVWLTVWLCKPFGNGLSRVFTIPLLAKLSLFKCTHMSLRVGKTTLTQNQLCNRLLTTHMGTVQTW